jgi:hypothetical protein
VNKKYEKVKVMAKVDCFGERKTTYSNNSIHVINKIKGIVNLNL